MRLAIIHVGCAALLVFAGCRESGMTERYSKDSEPVVTETEYRDGTYFWKPDRITMTLHDGDHLGTSGQYILLENNLSEDEYGWGTSILDLPDNWKINDLRFDGLAIRFGTDQGEEFSVQPPKLNDLDFDILDGGDKSDKVLEELWRRYGLLETTRTEQGAALDG